MRALQRFPLYFIIFVSFLPILWVSLFLIVFFCAVSLLMGYNTQHTHHHPPPPPPRLSSFLSFQLLPHRTDPPPMLLFPIFLCCFASLLLCCMCALTSRRECTTTTTSLHGPFLTFRMCCSFFCLLSLCFGVSFSPSYVAQVPGRFGYSITWHEGPRDFDNFGSIVD